MTNKQEKTFGKINPRCVWSNSNNQYLVIRDKREDEEINNFIASFSSSWNTHILEHVIQPETQVYLASKNILPIEHESPLEKYQGSLI